MIYGIGTGIASVAGADRLLKESNAHERETVFSMRERELIFSRDAPAASCATRLAGKQAVKNALRIQACSAPQEIEILENSFGGPVAVLSGAAASAAKEKGVHHVELSLSYEADLAVGLAVAE